MKRILLHLSLVKVCTTTAPSSPAFLETLAQLWSRRGALNQPGTVFELYIYIYKCEGSVRRHHKSVALLQHLFQVLPLTEVLSNLDAGLLQGSLAIQSPAAQLDFISMAGRGLQTLSRVSCFSTLCYYPLPPVTKAFLQTRMLLVALWMCEFAVRP